MEDYSNVISYRVVLLKSVLILVLVAITIYGQVKPSKLSRTSAQCMLYLLMVRCLVDFGPGPVIGKIALYTEIHVTCMTMIFNTNALCGCNAHVWCNVMII